MNFRRFGTILMIVGAGFVIGFFVLKKGFDPPYYYEVYKNSLRYEITDTQGNPKELFRQEDDTIASMLQKKDREWYEKWKESSHSNKRLLYTGGFIILIGYGFFILAKN